MCRKIAENKILNKKVNFFNILIFKSKDRSILRVLWFYRINFFFIYIGKLQEHNPFKQSNVTFKKITVQ